MKDLFQYVIYERPSDYPADYVCRRHVVNASGSKPDVQPLFIRTQLNDLRDEMMKLGLARIDRDPRDEKHIIETWI